MNQTGKNIVLWIIIGLGFIVLFNLFQGDHTANTGAEIPYSDFKNAIASDQVSDVTLRGQTIRGRYKDGREFSSVMPYGDGRLYDTLNQYNVRFTVQPMDEGGRSFLEHFLSWLPMLLLVGVWIFLIRQMQSGSNKALGFGKSKARLLSESSGKVTFDDVAGVDEAKEEVQEIVEFLRDPQKFQKLGGKIPKGVLLVGSPGTGKTLLARAIAGEANVPFFSISGSDFVEMFVGVGASRVRDLFEQGKKNAPCIIFIDEIDAVGRHRGFGIGGGNDEREQTLNQLLVEMDGFETNEGVILIAATNRADVLDRALLRPGRFDRQVTVPLPDIKGREQILNVHLKKVALGQDVDASVIARGTPGFSGADLENLVNEAALYAARQNKRVVTMKDLEFAKDKIIMGPERRTMVMGDQEKKITAYHEAGHAIVGCMLPDSDPIHKATIIPRGRALGMVVRLPQADRISMSRKQILADLAVAMGGRVAEELIFGYDAVTTGASSDISSATQYAREMVVNWGLSDLMGPVSYRETDTYGQKSHEHSQETLKNIDKEVKRIVDEGYKTAMDILTKNKAKLHDLAMALLEYETLTGDEVSAVLKNGKWKRPVTTTSLSGKSASARILDEQDDKDEKPTQENKKTKKTVTKKTSTSKAKAKTPKGKKSDA